MNNNIANSFNLYVLRLIKDKYYVGITHNDPLIRFNQHKYGIGAQWTKLYKPLNIVETFKSTNMFDEDKLTKMYMNKFGIENVRGGSYAKINLEEYQLKALKMELCTANNLCFKCGKRGHFAFNCKS